MKKGFRSQMPASGSLTPLEEGKILFGEVVMVMDLLYREQLVRPQEEYLNVHLLSESVAMMFPKSLVAQHGFVYHLASRSVTCRFEDPRVVRALGWEVELRFRREDRISPKLGYLKVVPHSWLLHEISGTVIDLIPLGGEPGVDYPARHALHPDRPPYNHAPDFELLQGKLPTPEKVKELWEKLEEWARDPARGNLARCA